MSNQAQRLIALDAFRGLCIIGMILVNHPGSEAHVYNQIAHVPWQGWTIADLVAPGFLWIVGAAIPLSLDERLALGATRKSLLIKIIRRFAILYLLGSVLDAGVALEYFIDNQAWSEFPLNGILQRIAWCYLLVAGFYLWQGLRGVALITLVCLAAYWLIVITFPVGSMQAGLYSQADNYGIWFDKVILGENLNSGQYLVTVLTGVASTTAGLLVGRRVETLQNPTGRPALILLGIGVAAILLGELMDEWIPLIRSLWTISMVILAAGYSLVLLLVLNYLARWTIAVRAMHPMIMVGLNPLLIYALAIIITGVFESAGVILPGGDWVSRWYAGYLFLLDMNFAPKLASVCLPLLLMTGLYLLAWILHRKRWYLRI